MTVSGIMMKKFSAVTAVAEDDEVKAVIHKLAHSDAGAVVVLSATGGLLGVISERELVRAMSARQEAFGLLEARDIMVTDFATCTPEQSELELLIVMAEKRIRHMPVMIGTDVVGMVTIDDAVSERLSKIGQLTQRATQEVDKEKRLNMLDSHVSESSAFLRLFQIMEAVQNEFGLITLDVRARQIFLEIGEADRNGTPLIFRDFMKFHRWGSYPLVKRLIGELEESGLVKSEQVDGDQVPKAQRLVLSDGGKQVFDRINEEVAKSFSLR